MIYYYYYYYSNYYYYSSTAAHKNAYKYTIQDSTYNKVYGLQSLKKMLYCYIVRLYDEPKWWDEIYQNLVTWWRKSKEAGILQIGCSSSIQRPWARRYHCSLTQPQSITALRPVPNHVWTNYPGSLVESAAALRESSLLNGSSAPSPLCHRVAWSAMKSTETLLCSHVSGQTEQLTIRAIITTFIHLFH